MITHDAVCNTLILINLNFIDQRTIRNGCSRVFIKFENDIIIEIMISEFLKSVNYKISKGDKMIKILRFDTLSELTIALELTKTLMENVK